jgi:hypothetical protein
MADLGEAAGINNSLFEAAGIGSGTFAAAAFVDWKNALDVPIPSKNRTGASKLSPLAGG